MTEHPEQSSDRRPLAKRPVFWLGLVAALLAILVALVVGMLIGGATGTAPTPSPTSVDRPTPAAQTPTAVVTPPAPDAAPIPDDCTGIYTRDWQGELDLALNPTWTDEPESGVRYASDDVGLQTMLEGTTRLTCIWATPEGGSDVGITTNIAALSEVQQEETRAALNALGYSCYEELEGTRCVVEQEGEVGAFGESHFLRSGVWIATAWVNAAPDGYTHDIVAAIFG
ncbi:hypothetical protein [Agromyces humatus]|uniref:DUF3558 domain-containing protein n=1 Tax=Agromyces humatus TaxID=279573 RepID=A0ABN2KUS4_9MICO|nr:hypothetical protein [Agromyces humatus]